MPFSRKGFTLIELLVIVSIIALLSTIVMTSIRSSRTRAENVSFQSTANSIQGSVGVCCTGGGAGIINPLSENDPRGDICTPASGSIYPDSAHLGTVLPVRDCSNVLGFSVVITPGTGNSGNIDHAECDRDGCDFIPET